MNANQKGFFAVVGSREYSNFSLIKKVVFWILSQGFGIASGGALGADLHALHAVILAGKEACQKSAVYLPATLTDAPKACQGAIQRFLALGGQVFEGLPGFAISKLFVRNEKLVKNSLGVFAFFEGESKGTLHACKCSFPQKKPLFIFPDFSESEDMPELGAGTFISMPGFKDGFQFISKNIDDSRQLKLSDLGKIFDHSNYGECYNGMMNHASDMPMHDRQLFEDLTQNGSQILKEHDNVSACQSHLSLKYLSSRLFPYFRSSQDAQNQIELFRNALISFDASREVTNYYILQLDTRPFSEVLAEISFFSDEMQKLSISSADEIDLEFYAGYEKSETEEAEEEVSEIIDFFELNEAEEVEETETLSAQSMVGMHVFGSMYEETETLWVDQQPETFTQLYEKIRACSSLEELHLRGAQLYKSADFSNIQKSVLFSAHSAKKAELTPKRLSPAAEHFIEVISASKCRQKLGAELFKIQKGELTPQKGKLPQKEEWTAIWKAYEFLKETPSILLSWSPSKEQEKPVKIQGPKIKRGRKSRKNIIPVLEPQPQPQPQPTKSPSIFLYISNFILKTSKIENSPGCKFGQKLLPCY